MHGAKDLLAMDYNGKSDPYCRPTPTPHDARSLLAVALGNHHRAPHGPVFAHTNDVLHLICSLQSYVLTVALPLLCVIVPLMALPLLCVIVPLMALPLLCVAECPMAMMW